MCKRIRFLLQKTRTADDTRNSNAPLSVIYIAVFDRGLGEKRSKWDIGLILDEGEYRAGRSI